MRNPFVVALFTLILMLILSMAIGAVFIPPTELWRVLTGNASNETFRTILLDIRLPRTILIALVGRGAGRERRNLSGIIPQPTGGPLSDRCGFGCGIGRDPCDVRSGGPTRCSACWLSRWQLLSPAC